MKNGEYCWEEDRLYAAHKSCQRKTENFMKKQFDTIIIDNTNIKKNEMLPYVQLAREYNYSVTIRSDPPEIKYLFLIWTIFREPTTPWKTDINQLVHKNVHGLNQTQLLKQEKNWYKCTATDLWNLTAPKTPETASENAAPKNLPKQIMAEKSPGPAKSRELKESDILSLKSNAEKMHALGNLHNFRITSEEEGG